MSCYNENLGDWKAFWQTITHPFEAWEKGAQELEETSPGRIITAPVRLADKLVGAAGKTVEGAGEAAKKIPTIMIVLSIGIAGYLIFAGRKGVKLTPF